MYIHIITVPKLLLIHLIVLELKISELEEWDVSEDESDNEEENEEDTEKKKKKGNYYVPI